MIKKANTTLIMKVYLKIVIIGIDKTAIFLMLFMYAIVTMYNFKRVSNISL